MAKNGSATKVSNSAELEKILDKPGNTDLAAGIANGNGKYTVVARRYRPKTFTELVGQSTVSQALLSAIESNRVGHAY